MVGFAAGLIRLTQSCSVFGLGSREASVRASAVQEAQPLPLPPRQVRKGGQPPRPAQRLPFAPLRERRTPTERPPGIAGQRKRHPSELPEDQTCSRSRLVQPHDRSIASHFMKLSERMTDVSLPSLPLSAPGPHSSSQPERGTGELASEFRTGPESRSPIKGGERYRCSKAARDISLNPWSQKGIVCDRNWAAPIKYVKTMTLLSSIF